MPDSLIDQLILSFRKFPGIGPRQARRFVYYLLRASPKTVGDLVSQISEIKKSIAQCSGCLRFFPNTYDLKPSPCSCSICNDPSRDSALLMVVEKDMDLENVERSDSYHGHYFVLGGLLPILDKNPEQHIRVKNLQAAIEARTKNGLKEIILALAANPEGDHTTQYLKQLLASSFQPAELSGKLLASKPKISILGRGLSTGTELEYSDADTLKNALKHRE